MKIFKGHVQRFMGHFNANDLNGVLNDFTDDGQYIDEFGKVHQGKMATLYNESQMMLVPICKSNGQP
jgi:hypothetical protein